MANVPKPQTRLIDIMKGTTLRQLQRMNKRTHEILLLSNTLKFLKVSRRFADSSDVPQLTRNGATFTLKQQLSNDYSTNSSTGNSTADRQFTNRFDLRFFLQQLLRNYYHSVESGVGSEQGLLLTLRKAVKFVGQGVVPFTIDHVVLNRIVSTLHQECLSVLTTDM